MDQDINVSIKKIQEFLQQTFDELAVETQPKQEEGASSNEQNKSLSAPSPQGKTSESETQTDNEPGEASEPELVAETTSSVSDEIANQQEPPPQQHPAGLSIFDSTSEYIIPGSELTSKNITLSTHSWHVMTRPTLLTHERYERNALLFSVGFVLRRAADPSPFRPLLSKLAVTLQAMEEESRFLTNHRPQIQTLLEKVLLSLNSADWECNLLLSRSNALHLKLYHPPKPETSPVHDHQVPILLRRDLQLQMVSVGGTDYCTASTMCIRISSIASSLCSTTGIWPSTGSSCTSMALRMLDRSQSRPK